MKMQQTIRGEIPNSLAESRLLLGLHQTVQKIHAAATGYPVGHLAGRRDIGILRYTKSNGVE